MRNAECYRCIKIAVAFRIQHLLFNIEFFKKKLNHV